MIDRKSKVCATITMVVLAFAVACPSIALAANGFVVDYRLMKWQSAHFDDATNAEVHFATVKKLGCQAKKDMHGGHVDVSFVCPTWRRIEVTSHEEAHEWEKWLKAYGFETRHSH